MRKTYYTLCSYEKGASDQVRRKGFKIFSKKENCNGFIEYIEHNQDFDYEIIKELDDIGNVYEVILSVKHKPL